MPADATDAGWVIARALCLWGIDASVAVVFATWQSTSPHTPAGVDTALTACAAVAVGSAVLAALLPAPDDRAAGLLTPKDDDTVRP